MLKRCVFSL